MGSGATSGRRDRSEVRAWSGAKADRVELRGRLDAPVRLDVKVLAMP
jgi:hypothetical protein